MTTSATGGCLCGAVRYTVTPAPTEIGACHCGMCRKFTGGIELGAMVAKDDVVFETTEHLRTYTSSEWAERAFCEICGSSLYWRLTAPGDQQGLTSLSAGTLDSLDGIALTSEVYIDNKPGSYAFAGDHKRMTEAEVMAMVGAAPEP